jgi:hypothetical protein
VFDELHLQLDFSLDLIQILGNFTEVFLLKEINRMLLFSSCLNLGRFSVKFDEVNIRLEICNDNINLG